MKSKRFIIICLSLFCLLWVAAAQARVPLNKRLAKAGFERIERQHGVTVYKHRNSPVIHIAAEGLFKATPQEVQQVLLDYHGQRGRMDSLSESQVLKRWDRALLVYQRLNLPVIDDRDFVLKVRWGINRAGTSWITYNALRRPPVALRQGVVRVVDHRGSWQLRSTRSGKATFVRFESRIDMAGMLPMWLARSTAAKEVPLLFQALRLMLQDRRPSRR